MFILIETLCCSQEEQINKDANGEKIATLISKLYSAFTHDAHKV